ncbi:hypothetical protein [Streptomyces sp. Ru71]|uniref:hypothetical protein n=1 Tax=Streptomyces sp. Ru71 TaxID=2080746 RepID=UPI00215613F2|nr:hypothetical protein [Streptomyces sp. Ru71]
MTSSTAIRAAAVVATAAMALGVAAPLAEATEAQSLARTTVTSTDEPTFTAAEVRDLIERMKADGGSDTAEIAQFEAYADRLEGKGPTKPMPGFGWSTIVRKLVVAGFRHGGVWLGKVLKRVSPKAAKYASKHGNKIADAIDAVENWGEHALALALMKAGLPHDIAGDLAKAIIIIAA